MNIKFIFILLGFCFCNNLFAQKELESNINELTISANRFVQKLNETGKTVTIISDTTLRQYEGLTLGQVLNMQSGLNIVGANGNFGTLQTVFTRGASSGNTLILWNGMPLSDASNIDAGVFDLNLIPIEQIGRIEIVKSSQSTLYGSDAMAGVINIITKETKGKKFSPFVNLAYGSFDTRRANGGFTLNSEKVQGGIVIGFQNTKGFSDAQDEKGDQNFDKDGSNSANFMGFLSVKITDKLKVRGFSNNNYYKANVDYDATLDEKDFNINNGFSSTGVGLDYIYEKGKVVFNAKMDGFSRKYLNDSLSYNVNLGKEYLKSDFTGNNIFTEAYINHRFNSNIGLILGADYRNFRSSATSVYISPFFSGTSKSPENAAKVNIASAYSMLYFKANALNLELGGRVNKHSIYGNNATFSFSPSYAFNEKIRIFATAASGFRAPSMYQIFTNSILRDSVNLKPERNISTELGVNIALTENVNFKIVVFSRQAKDLLFYLGATNKYINIEKQNDKGIEIERNFQVGKFDFSANYTYLTGEITKKLKSNKDTVYNNLFRRPTHNFNFSTNFQVNKKCLLRANARVLSERKDLFFDYATYKNTVVTLKSYAVLDLYGEYKFNATYKAFLQLGNITDTKYTDIYGYNTRRFNVMLGVSAKW